MTSKIYNHWLSKLNQRMIEENRKILLIVDNAPSHPHYSKSNIKVEFLYPNLTSAIQPMDAGIIHAFKSKYRKKHWREVINIIESTSQTDSAFEISQLQAMIWIREAWDEVSSETIKNCFSRTGTISVGTSRLFPNLQDDIDDTLLSSLLDNFSFKESINQLNEEESFSVHCLEAQEEVAQPPKKKRKITLNDFFFKIKMFPKNTTLLNNRGLNNTGSTVLGE